MVTAPNWEDDFVTVAEVAERLQLNQQTIRNWIDDKTLPAVRVGRRVRIRRVDMDAFLAAGATVEPAPALPGLGPEAREQLAQALDRANRALSDLAGIRRAELSGELQALAETVSEALGSGSTSPAVPS